MAPREFNQRCTNHHRNGHPTGLFVVVDVSPSWSLQTPRLQHPTRFPATAYDTLHAPEPADVAIGSHWRTEYVIAFDSSITYKHHVIYIGHGKVAEYDRQKGIVVRSWDDRDSYIEVNYPKQFSADEIAKRALSRVGEAKYDLLFNNCEHFAYWCTMDRSVSKQVISGAAGAAAVVGLSVLAVAAGFAGAAAIRRWGQTRAESCEQDDEEDEQVSQSAGMRPGSPRTVHAH